MEYNFEKINELEEIVNQLVPDPYQDINKDYLNALNNWADLIYDEVEKGKQLILNDQEIELGLKLANNPIFICGAARSGTTYYRNLLDSHEQLSVLCIEIGINKTLWNKNDNELKRLVHRYYLFGLVRSSQVKPYFILGRSTTNYSPYLKQTLFFFAWWEIVFKNKIHPIASLALANYFINNKQFDKNKTKYWVEKTPFNELHIDNIKRYFPNAKFIILYRNPINVYKSLKTLHENFKNFKKKRFFQLFSETVASHKFIAKNLNKDNKNIFFIKYESLVEKTSEIQKNVAKFLNINYNETLLKPTINNIEAGSNTSFSKDIKKNLNPNYFAIHDQQKISVLFKKSNKILGYENKNSSLHNRIIILTKFHTRRISNLVKRSLKKLVK